MLYWHSFTVQKSLRRCHPFLGLDDFAFRKGHTYGTVICDHQTGTPLALLQDRRPETVTPWLNKYPFVQIVSRDGYTTYRHAITKANPNIIQIYDRWHFIRNAKKQVDIYINSRVPPTITSVNLEVEKVYPE